MIKILGWILLFYIIYTLFKNLIGPILGGPRQRQRGYSQPYDNGGDYRDSQHKRPGETTIKQRPDTSSRQHDDDDGEYIDYKEIK